MKTPRFMTCVAREAEAPDGGEYVVDTELGILWFFDEGSGSVVEWLSDPIKDASILSEAARMAGEWYVEFMNEEDEYED